MRSSRSVRVMSMTSLLWRSVSSVAESRANTTYRSFTVITDISSSIFSLWNLISKVTLWMSR